MRTREQRLPRPLTVRIDPRELGDWAHGLVTTDVTRGGEPWRECPGRRVERNVA